MRALELGDVSEKMCFLSVGPLTGYQGKKNTATLSEVRRIRAVISSVKIVGIKYLNLTRY